jgi:hypothetical protein
MSIFFIDRLWKFFFGADMQKTLADTVVYFPDFEDFRMVFCSVYFYKILQYCK